MTREAVRLGNIALRNAYIYDEFGNEIYWYDNEVETNDMLVNEKWELESIDVSDDVYNALVLHSVNTDLLIKVKEYGGNAVENRCRITLEIDYHSVDVIPESNNVFWLVSEPLFNIDIHDGCDCCGPFTEEIYVGSKSLIVTEDINTAFEYAFYYSGKYEPEDSLEISVIDLNVPIKLKEDDTNE